MAATAQYLSSSPLGYPVWAEGIPDGAFVGTSLPSESDVLVLGGGLAGILVAYFLAILGVRVVLIEQGRLCGGSSGRNGGFIVPGRADYGELVDRWGPVLAEQIVNFEVRSTNELVALTKELGIEADFRFNGHVALAFDEDGMRKIQRSAELLRGIEFPVEVWAREECLSKTVGPNFVGGLFRRNGGTLSPMKLAVGLAEAAVSRGAVIKTYTQVGDLQRTKEGGILAVTNGGNIVAQHIVFATNTVEPRFLPPLARAIEPTRGQVLATKPISRQVWKEFGLGTMDGFAYWHQDVLGRIVIGGMRHFAQGLERGVTDISQTNPQVGEALRMFLGDQFPDLAEEFEVAYEWTGIMGVSRDGLPLVGPLPPIFSPFHKAWLLLGFGGHGMPVIPGAALALAQMIAGKTPTNFVEAFRPTAEKFAESV